MTLPIRCDSPGERRFCDLRIAPAGGGLVDFESRALRREARDAVHVLETGRAPTSAISRSAASASA